MSDTATNVGAVPPRQYPVIDGACEGVKNFLRGLEPSPEVVRHFRNARIEMLKGFRQMLDNRIERLSRTNPQGQKITVE